MIDNDSFGSRLGGPGPLGQLITRGSSWLGVFGVLECV